MWATFYSSWPGGAGSHALAFFSKKLSGAGTWYSTFDKELLAAFSVVGHFRFLLEGRRFRLPVGGLASGFNDFESSTWQPTGSTSSPWAGD